MGRAMLRFLPQTARSHLTTRAMQLQLASVLQWAALRIHFLLRHDCCTRACREPVLLQTFAFARQAWSVLCAGTFQRVEAGLSWFAL